MLPHDQCQSRHTGSGHAWDKLTAACLRSLIIITNAESAFLAKTMSPEAIDGGRTGEIVMGDEKPEPENGFGEDIQDSVGDYFSVDTDVARTISDTPDAVRG